jgi:hypothetical protein
VEVVGESCPDSLSGRTAVEEQKLRRRPEGWRLACQALVQHSVLVLTRPQVGLQGSESLITAAKAQPLPAGPTAWPVVENEEPDDEDGGEDTDAAQAPGASQSATSGEEP